MASTANPSRLEAAAERLTAALSALEAAAARRLEGDRSQLAALSQLAAMDEDRARLAEELDRSAERIAGLEATNREVARRLDQTMGAIRAVLAAYGA